MFKKLISIIVVALMVSASVSISGFAADTTVIVNEVFDNYALNGTPENISVSGIVGRVVQRKDSDKALYAMMWGSGLQFNAPLNQTFDKMVFSFDIMSTGGKFIGGILALNNTASFLTFNENGSISLEDGFELSGLPNGKWRNYKIAVDFEAKKYDLYIDDKIELKNRYMSQNPIVPKEFNIAFSPVDMETISEVYVDNVRVYEGRQLLSEKAFQKKTANKEVLEFTPTKDKPVYDRVYIDSYGKEGFGSINFVAKEDTQVGWAMHPESELECVRFYQEGTTDCYADITVGSFNSNSYVYQLDIYPVSMPTGLSTLGRAQSDGYSDLLTLSGGSLKCNGKVVSSIPYGKWTTVAIACDLFTGLADVYVNGELALAKTPLHNGGRKPDTMRLTFNTIASVGKNEIYFNRIKLYDGYELREFDDTALKDAAATNQNSGQYQSGHDTEDMAKKMLRTDSVFMTSNDSYFADGEKKKYSDYGSAAYVDENGVVMVPAKLLADSIGAEITVSDNVIRAGGATVRVGSADSSVGKLSVPPTEKNGVLYLPAASFAKVMLSKYAYEDDRGFVLISDTDRGYTNSLVTFDNLEDIDMLYRYMQFERPSADRVYNDVLKNSHGVWPRTFVRKEDIGALRAKVASDGLLKNGLASLISLCEGYIGAPVTEYKITDNLRLFNSYYTIRIKLFNLGIAYLLTGDKKYADCMWLEMENALSWKDWNVDKHYLDSGKLAPAMAFSYDVLHDYLTEKQRSYFRERVEELYLDAAVRCYTNELYCGVKNTRLTTSNWGAVCSSGMLLMSLVLIDEEPADSEFTEKCKFIAKNAIQSFEYPIGMFFPDGAVSDGAGYWDYYMEAIGWSVKTLLNMCGTDYGLLTAPGYKTTPEYLLYIQSKSGRYNYKSTTGEGAFWVPEVFLIASLYEDDEMMRVLDTARKQMGFGISAFDLLWYEPTEGEGKFNYALDKNFVGEGIVTMRGSWTDRESPYFGALYGLVHNRSHYDKGSFIYDAGGARWFVDFGTENYNVPGGYNGEGGKTLYRIRAEAHNGIVINPTANDPGQTPNGIATCERMESKPKGAILVVDLKDVYKGHVKEYRRGFYFGDNRQTLIVQDELELAKDNSDFYHFLHTRANVEIASDGKSAILEQQGKKLKVEFYCDAPEWKLEVRNEDNMFPENDREGEYSRDGYRKITLFGRASGKLKISAKITLVGDEVYPPLEVTDIHSWSIPDGEIPTKPKLSELLMNGKAVDGFNPDMTECTIAVPAGMEMPLFEAKSSNGVVLINQPDSFEDYVEITVTDDFGKVNVYKVYFELEENVLNKITDTETEVGLPGNIELLECVNVRASDIPQGNNPPESSVDGSHTTKWASDISGSTLEIALGEIKDLSGIAISFESGEKREYAFEILVSEDKRNYTRIYDGKSSGKTNEYEYIEAPIKAKYIRFIGYGNSVNEWINVSEFHGCVSK